MAPEDTSARPGSRPKREHADGRFLRSPLTGTSWRGGIVGARFGLAVLWSRPHLLGRRLWFALAALPVVTLSALPRGGRHRRPGRGARRAGRLSRRRRGAARRAGRSREHRREGRICDARSGDPLEGEADCGRARSALGDRRRGDPGPAGLAPPWDGLVRSHPVPPGPVGRASQCPLLLAWPSPADARSSHPIDMEEG